MLKQKIKIEYSYNGKNLIEISGRNKITENSIPSSKRHSNEE